MRRRAGSGSAVVVGLMALTLLAGCGDDGGTPGPGTSSGPSSERGAACADSSAVDSADTLASIDLDGDGTREPVLLTAPGGECGDLLFAEVDGAPHGLDTPALSPMEDATRAVQLPGRKGELLLVEQGQVGGGYQPRLFGYARDGLAELVEDDKPVLPFVATDATVIPYTVSCARNGFVMDRAVAHEPPGVVFAWDIQRTTYRVKGTKVTHGKARETADNVLPERLGEEYPALARHDLFPDC